MKKTIKILRNRYVWSTLFTVVYILIMHDTDIFALNNRLDRVDELKHKIERKKEEIAALRIEVEELEDIRALEKYAREEHYFRKKDEDLFIFSFR